MPNIIFFVFDKLEFMMYYDDLTQIEINLNLPSTPKVF